MKDCTDIVVILDRSGSMARIKTDTEGGFDTFVQEQQKEPGECHLSLYQFDDQYTVVFESKPIAEVGKLDLRPRGSTALLDAIGKTINTRGEYYASLPEEERPARVVVVIITDGQENASREFSNDQIKTLIETQQGTYNWQFIFLGANIDSFSVAGQIGILRGTTMDFGTSGAEVHGAYAAASSSISSYRSMAPESACLDSFTDSDRMNAKNKN